MLPSFIIMEKEKKKSTKEETAPNREAIPPDDY
jgi:hypothetical protein